MERFNRIDWLVGVYLLILLFGGAIMFWNFKDGLVVEVIMLTVGNIVALVFLVRKYWLA